MFNQLSDNFEKTMSPLISVTPCFGKEWGIFSDLERLMMNPPEKIVINTQTDDEIRPSGFYQNYLQSQNIQIPFSFTSEIAKPPLTPGQLLENFPCQLIQDLQLLQRNNFQQKYHDLIEGEKSQIWIHNEAEVSPMALINSEKGPVVIDCKARISAFSILKGPLYIGPESVLDKTFISNSRVGRQCRIGGEISDSLIGNFSNKHHEGFLGHSIVGDWVNLGALTTTSDLKNNYGKIRLQYKDQSFDTNRIKFGSIIGDFVKTGIGTLLNTGTVLNLGATLFTGCPVQKYYPSFFWGGETPGKYELARFLKDQEIIMARRNSKPDDFLKNQITFLHSHAQNQ